MMMPLLSKPETTKTRWRLCSSHQVSIYIRISTLLSQYDKRLCQIIKVEPYSNAVYHYRPQRSCGKVMFSHLPVSHSSGQTPLSPPPPRRRLLQRTVRILLECILVISVFSRWRESIRLRNEADGHRQWTFRHSSKFRFVLNVIICNWNFVIYVHDM